MFNISELPLCPPLLAHPTLQKEQHGRAGTGPGEEHPQLCQCCSASRQGLTGGVGMGRGLPRVAGQHPRSENLHAVEKLHAAAWSLCPRTLNSLGDGLDDLGGGVLEVGEQAPGATPQDVQEPTVGLVVFGHRQACKQRQASGHSRAGLGSQRWGRLEPP